MTLEEIKAIAETWFDWPEEDRCHVTYTSAMLFARDMYERGQKAEREKYQELIAAAEAAAHEINWGYFSDRVYLSNAAAKNLRDVVERMKTNE